MFTEAFLLRRLIVYSEKHARTTNFDWLFQPDFYLLATLQSLRCRGLGDLRAGIAIDQPK